MFQSSKGSEPATQTSGETARSPVRGSGEPSTISADLKVVGNLHCAGDIHIKGTVEGDIRSRSVEVGEGAHVQGSIVADTVRISGSIKGQIEAPNVTVAKTAKMIGDIVHETLSIEAGAHVEGNCRRLESKKTGETAGVQSIKPAQAGTQAGAQSGGSAGAQGGTSAAGSSDAAKKTVGATP